MVGVLAVLLRAALLAAELARGLAVAAVSRAEEHLAVGERGQVRLGRAAADRDRHPVQGGHPLVAQRVENRVVDEVRVTGVLVARHPVVGFLDLLVQQLEVPIHFAARLLRHGGQPVLDRRAGDVGRARFLDLVRIRPGRVHVRLRVDPHDRPEVGRLVTVLAGRLRVGQAVVGRVGADRQVADEVVDVLRAVGQAWLGDRVVGAELAALVGAAVDRENALGAVLLHLRVDDVLGDLLDAHERTDRCGLTVLRRQCHGGGARSHHGDRRQRRDQAELPSVGFAVCHTSSSLMPCMIRSTCETAFRLNESRRVIFR